MTSALFSKMGEIDIKAIEAQKQKEAKEGRKITIVLFLIF